MINHLRLRARGRALPGRSLGWLSPGRAGKRQQNKTTKPSQFEVESGVFHSLAAAQPRREKDKLPHSWLYAYKNCVGATQEKLVPGRCASAEAVSLA